jgi:hypothetical protein
MENNQSQRIDLNRSTVELQLSLTGNPWTDVGIVSFCHEIQDNLPAFLEKPPFWTEYEVSLSVYYDSESMKEMEEWLYDIMRTRWNQLYWLSKPAKIFDRSLILKNGFVDSSEKLSLLSEEKKRVKDILKEKGVPASSIKDTMPLTQDRLNYAGTRSDRNNIQKQMKNIVIDFINNWITSDGTKRCDLCGRYSDKLNKATQSINPLMNKYHNNRVRNFTSSNDYYQQCPICYFTNMCTVLDANIPFVFDGSSKQRFLIFPDVPNLELLGRVYKRLGRNLIDLSELSQLHTSTNLRAYWWHDPYSLSLVLFHNIFYEFSIHEDNGEEEWSFEPTVDKRKVNRWLILPFIIDKNVRFGNIHVIQVDDRLYDYIKPIPTDGEVQPLQLVPDILSRISPSSRHPKGIEIIQCLSKAIATSDVKLLKEAVFLLWKHSDAINCYIKQISLSRFIQHFLEVNDMLNDELRADLRAMGIIIGSAFSHDVTLISKLYNVSSEGAFRSVINQVLFRLYKLSTSGKITEDGKFRVEAQGEPRNITRVSQERLTRVLDQLSSENWKEMAETLSTFASLSAFNANFSKSQK